MKNNDDLLSKVLEQKKQSVKNNSESNILSRSLTVIPEDDSKDLHITGFKIGINDEEYYFTFGKGRGKSENVLGTSAGRSELLTGTNSSDSTDRNLSLKSKSLSPCHISNYENISFTTGSDTESQPVCIIENNKCKVGTHRVKNSEDSRADQSKCTTKLFSTGTQTEKEISSSGVQTTVEDESSLRRADETSTQTKRAKDIWKETDEKTTKTESNQTLGIQTTAPTSRQIRTGTTQTQNSTILSVQREQDTSFQTKRSDVGTSTDFDFDTVDMERTSDKLTDTKYLRLDSLCLAKAETLEVLKNEHGGKSCLCSQEDKKEKNFTCCWNPRKYPKMIPESLRFCHNLNNQASPWRIHECVPYSCQLESQRDYIDKRNFGCLEDNLAQECSNNSAVPNSEGFSRTGKNVVEEKRPTKDTKLDSTDISPLTMQETIRVQSRFEIAENLKLDFEGAQFYVAVKLFKSLDDEKVSVLQIPVTITHFLESFFLKRSGSSKVIVNPVEIGVTGKPDKLDGQRKNVKAIEEREATDMSKRSSLLISDEKTKKSVLVSCLLPSVSGPDNAHPRICLCNQCYSSIQRVLQSEQGQLLQKDLTTGREKIKSCNDQSATLPMIKHRDFDYSSKEGWKPCDKKDEFECRETSATDITDIIESSSEKSLERDETMWFSDACEIVNDHLLDLRPVDEDKLQKAAKILHNRWFEVAGTKSSNIQEIKMHIQYFEEFSFNLLKTLLHSVDNNGNNVFHFAFANNRFDLVEELLQQSGFTSELLNKKNKIGNSPLLICSISQPRSERDWLTIRKCFEIGDVNLKSSKSGQTPLMNASSCGFDTMVELLVDVGANPNLQDKDGSTALMYAAEHGHESCVKVLMSHKKCDPTIRDKDAETACSIALNNGHKNIAVLIHMQALEKRRSKNPCPTRRYIWTDNNAAVRKRSLAMVATSDSWNSPAN